jgi:hypothetical protein
MSDIVNLAAFRRDKLDTCLAIDLEALVPLIQRIIVRHKLTPDEAERVFESLGYCCAQDLKKT